MTTLVVLTVVEIVLLIAGLAAYLWIVSTQLTKVAGTLEECNDLVATIEQNASVITPGVEHINHTGGDAQKITRALITAHYNPVEPVRTRCLERCAASRLRKSRAIEHRQVA